MKRNTYYLSLIHICGAIRIEGRPSGEGKEVYPLESFAEIRRFCEERALRLSDYAFVCEGEALKEYLKEVWQAMKASVEAGLKAQGVLPGGLGVDVYKRQGYDRARGCARRGAPSAVQGEERRGYLYHFPRGAVG